MIKNIAIVSLSSGIAGEPFVQFEVEIGLRRLKELGPNVRFMPHALMGLEYIKAHPYTLRYFEELIATGGIRALNCFRALRYLPINID